MKTSSALLLAAASLVVGAAVVAVISYDSNCEPEALYVLELNGADFKSSMGVSQEPLFIKAIKTRHSGGKAIFRHGLTKKSVANASPTIPPGYEDDGLTCKTKGKAREKAGGLHVTQRIGYGNETDLKEALKYLLEE